MHRATIYVDPIYSHVPTGFAQAVGVPGDIRFDFKTAGNLAYANIADLFPQLVMRPFNRTTVYYYDIVIDDPTGASGLVTVPSEVMNDRFNVEVYAQDADGNPQWMMARGTIDLTGYGHLNSGRRAAGATSGGGGGGGGSEPGGTAGQVQFNADPALGGFGYWDGTSTLSLGNATTPQVLKLYETHAGTLAAPTGATWFEASWTEGAFKTLNLLTLGSGDSSTHARMKISTGGYHDMEISAAYIALVAGLGGTATYYAAADAFTPSANNTLDLGRTVTRFKTVYAGNYIGANFTAIAQGLTPLSGGGTTNFLRADGTWASPGGGAIIADIAPSTVTTPSGSLWFEGDTGFFYVLYDSGTPAWVQIDNTGLPVPYTTGDLLYASNTTTLAKLSAGTAGHVLTSGGAGVAPAWAAGGGSGSIAPLQLVDANTVHQRNGANEQHFRVYQSYNDASNGLWLETNWSGGTMYLRTIGNGAYSAGANMIMSTDAQLGLTGGSVLVTSGSIPYYFTNIDFMCNGIDTTIALGRAGKRWSILYLGAMLVSELPTAAANMQGARATVTNATGPTFLATVAGGGAVVAPVFCNGTAWIVG